MSGKIDQIMEAQRQPWIGMTGLLPDEMAGAVQKSLEALGYPYQREPDKYHEIAKIYSFILKNPQVRISFAYFGPECPTFPLCPTLLECVWTKPIPLARVEPVNEETKPVLDRIFAKARETMPRDISEMTPEFKDYYRRRHGEQRNIVFKQCIQKKWSYWGYKLG